jgi:GWxTD domain-containing protein
VSAAGLPARDSNWLAAVSPVMTAAERRTYVSLAPEAQQRFQENFWTEKAITPEEYYRRLQYVDSTFGSTKIASGANTDPGRVYLSLGPPDRITRIPSSRIFEPLEIWYYNTVPSLHLETELHLIFYQKNSLGLLKLYSPTLDTIRALLLPQSSTIGIFGPNDELTEDQIRTNLTVGPAEDEVVTAAVGVAAGLKHTGNDELLSRIASPEYMLRKPQQTEVQSHFFVARPPLQVIQSNSPFGGRQVDFVLQPSVAHQLDFQVLDGAVTVYQNRLHLKFDRPDAVQYVHRLDLLPGTYTAIFTIDGKSFPYAVTVPAQPSIGEIFRVNDAADIMRDRKPLSLSANGTVAVVSLPQPGEVTWTLRKGMQVLLKSVSHGLEFAPFNLPSPLEPGTYSLEANDQGISRTTDLKIGPDTKDPTLLSFNANLDPALRWSFLGHQWLLKNNLPEARRCLETSLSFGVTKEAQVELARAEALAGQWDSARTRARQILATQPNDFDSLTVLAYIETKLQDYAVAAALYRRALAVQDSPALRMALAKLPPASVAN